MIDYTEAAQRRADNEMNYRIDEIKSTSYLSEEQKEQRIEEVKKAHEYEAVLNKAIAKVLTAQGTDFFRDSEYMQEKELFNALMKDGVLKDKPFEDGSGSRIVLPDGYHSYPPAFHEHYLAERAGDIVRAEAFHHAYAMSHDVLNPEGKKTLNEFRNKHNNQGTVSRMNIVSMKFIEECAENPRTFTQDSLDLTAKTSEETKNKSIVGEEEFKALLAERVRDHEKVKEFANALDKRYYGEGLMAQQDPITQAITYTVDGQQIDEKSFFTLQCAYDWSDRRDNKLTDGVQYGSLMCIYNPDSRDSATGEYKEMKWLTSDGQSGLKEVSEETAQQIYNSEKQSGKNVNPKLVRIENYGGGLMHLKDQHDNSMYINAKNITHPNSGKSHNMARAQIINRSKGCYEC